MSLSASVHRTPSSADWASNRQQIGLALSLLGREVLAFHPRLVKLSGRVTAALMLSQSLYWSRVLIEQNKSNNREDREGWFWKTRADWLREIALSKHEQDSARKRLRALPCWQERRKGLPAKMHFRVDADELARQIDHDFQGHWDWQDRRQALQLLGRPVLVFRQLADLCQSVTAAILLSQLLGEERSALRISQRQDNWHSYQFQQLMSVTGLTRDELIHARKILREHGYLIERRIGVPPRSEWRLSLSPLVDDLRSAMQARTNATKELSTSRQAPSPMTMDATDICAPSGSRMVDQIAGNRQSCLPESGEQEKSVAHALPATENKAEEIDQNRPETRVVIQLSGIRTTGNRESGQQETGKPDNLMPGITNNRCPDSRFLYKGLTTGKPITKTTPSPTPPVASTEVRGSKSEPGFGGGGLSTVSTSTSQRMQLPVTTVWPNLLLAEERVIANRLLAEVGEAAQLILDELAGQNALAPIRQPLAYLRKLAAQAQTGNFVPGVAMRVAEQRRQQQVRLNDLQKKPPSPAVMSVEQRDTGRKKIEAMRARLRHENTNSDSAGRAPFTTLPSIPTIPTRH